MNPNTGEDLALANYPTYDPSELPGSGYDPASVRMDLGVRCPSSRGSIFKVMTLSAAIETTDADARIRRINCVGGTLELTGRVIHEAPGDHFAIAEHARRCWRNRATSAPYKSALKVGHEKMYE